VTLLRQGGWTRWPTEVPSNPYYSVILWLSGWFITSKRLFAVMIVDHISWPQNTNHSINIFFLLLWGGFFFFWNIKYGQRIWTVKIDIRKHLTRFNQQNETFFWRKYFMFICYYCTCSISIYLFCLHLVVVGHIIWI